MNRFRSIGQNILIIDKYMKLYLKNSLKPYNLNAAEGMVLLELYGHDGQTQDEIICNLHQQNDGLTQEQIIDRLHYDKGVMTRTMQSLEKKGYIKRSDNDSDGRSHIFYLTPCAKNFKVKLIDILQHWSEEVQNGLDENDIKTIDLILKIMAENSKNFNNRG